MFYICWIPHRYSVRHLLVSSQKLFCVGFCAETLMFLLDCVQKFYSISSAFHTEFLFDTCWIPRRNSVRYLLDSSHKFCSIYVGFCAEVLFRICWIPCRNSGRYLLDSVHKFSSMSTGFRTEMLFDIYWIAYRNSTRCLLHFTQKFSCISAGFRTELVFRKTSNVCRRSQYLLSLTGREDLAVVKLGSRSPLQAICT